MVCPLNIHNVTVIAMSAGSHSKADTAIGLVEVQ